jgi:hypothetical protein
VLLAAALAAGISQDDKLGIVRLRTETGRVTDELRAEMDELRWVWPAFRTGSPASMVCRPNGRALLPTCGS